MTESIKLTLKNLKENWLLQYKILTEDNREIANGSMYNEKIIIDIPKDYYNKPLKLIIENRAFSGGNFKSLLYLFMYFITCLGSVNDEGFLGKPFTYVYEFILYDEAIINFYPKDKNPFKPLKGIETLCQEKIVSRSHYIKWIWCTFIPVELFALFFAILFGGVSKHYLILGVIPFLIIQLIIYFYIKKLKKNFHFINN